MRRMLCHVHGVGWVARLSWLRLVASPHALARPLHPLPPHPQIRVQEDQERVQAVLLSLSHACRLAKVDLPYDVLPTLLAAVFGAA